MLCVYLVASFMLVHDVSSDVNYDVDMLLSAHLHITLSHRVIAAD